MTIDSLGAHEHWNNAADKQYSRDLGTGDGIELMQVTSAERLTLPTRPPVPWTTKVGAAAR